MGERADTGRGARECRGTHVVEDDIAPIAPSYFYFFTPPLRQVKSSETGAQPRPIFRGDILPYSVQ